MLEFGFYVNVMLFGIGIALIYILFSKQKEHPFLTRAILVMYFLVVLQYNFDRFHFLGEKVLLGTAVVSLLAWIRQPVPSSEID